MSPPAGLGSKKSSVVDQESSTVNKVTFNRTPKSRNTNKNIIISGADDIASEFTVSQHEPVMMKRRIS
jgi:hypothetical protein